MSSINLIFLADNHEYPQGMAGTKRIQHAIDGLKNFSDISIRVVILRQSSRINALNGVHKGIPYETVMADIERSKLVLLAPLLHAKAKRVIRRVFRPAMKNILYVYGPPTIDKMPTIRYARRLGFKVIFDIIEDEHLARNINKNLWHWIKNFYTCRFLDRITSISDGIVVISSHLENKFREVTSGRIPMHFRSISVDMDCYNKKLQLLSDPLTLFYSGTFALKDGVLVLLDSFDQLAAKHDNIRLVLTGKGDHEHMRKSLARIDASPHRNRIDYKGYLDDETYYSTLNAADIPCMTRLDIPYAHAGFPFKFGEFLATGKPVIASRVSDVECIVDNRKEAMLVKPGDSNEIVSAVEYLMANPEEATYIGMRGREKARTCFDYRSQGQKLIEFLRNL